MGKGSLWIAAVLMIAAIAAGGCKGVETIERVRVDTLTIEKVRDVEKVKWRVDSVYVRDSMSVMWVQDTCVVERWNWKYREKVVVDTLRMVDTLRVKDVRTEKEVVVDETKVAKAKKEGVEIGILGGALLAVLIGLAVWAVVRWVRRYLLL